MLRRMMLLSVILVACGSQREIETKGPIQQSPPPPSGIPPSADFSQVQTITNQYCLRCHGTSQFLKTEKAWKASDAKVRLTARTMPPAGTNEAKSLSDTDRSFLISF